MVRVIKWHINIKAYNTVTLSFIASINPQRQTFHPPSVQIVFLHCQVVPNELSPRTYAFIIYLSIQINLAIVI